MSAEDSSVTQLLVAATFSAERHRDQRRKGERVTPYINHPLEVAERIARIGGVHDIEVLVAAILHDTIEDTETTAEEIERLFGPTVAALVLEVTDDRSLTSMERKRLEIEHAPLLTPRAKLIKGAKLGLARIEPGPLQRGANVLLGQSDQLNLAVVAGQHVAPHGHGVDRAGDRHQGSVGAHGRTAM